MKVFQSPTIQGIQGSAHGSMHWTVDLQSQERRDHHALQAMQAPFSPRWLRKGGRQTMSLTLQEEGALHSSETTCGGGPKLHSDVPRVLLPHTPLCPLLPSPSNK